MIAGPWILVVEDNEANQMLARAVLEMGGYRVEIAGSAREADDVLRTIVPDLILMDVQLPGIDGLTYVRRLKAQPSTSRVPIVALTAHAMPGDRDLALAAGCAGYIAKPIEVGKFADQVRQFLPDRDRDQRAVAR